MRSETISTGLPFVITLADWSNLDWRLLCRLADGDVTITQSEQVQVLTQMMKRTITNGSKVM